MRRVLPLLLIGLSAGSASAAEFCVTDIGGLQSAWTSAASNNEDDTIHLEVGQYNVPSSLDMTSADPHSVSLEGGYTHTFGQQLCDMPPTSPNAAATTLKGSGSARLNLLQAAGAVNLSNMTIDNMFEAQSSFPGVMIQATNIVVSNVIFSNNASIPTNGVILGASDAIQVQNSLFFGNASIAGGGASAVLFTNGNMTADSLCTLIVNSTFAYNLTSSDAIEIFDQNCISIVANDLFWGHDFGDAEFVGETYLINDDITAFDGQTVDLQGVVSIEPLFVDVPSRNLALRDDSPLRDWGSDGGSFIWGPGEWDVAGNPRVDGLHPDIGAFEIQDVIFASGVDVQYP